MNARLDLILGMSSLGGSSLREGRLTPEAVARKMESVFLSELLKVMLEQTSFGRERVFSTYMPFITSAVADSLAERQTGMSEMLLRNPSFREMLERSVEDVEKRPVSFKKSPDSAEKIKKE